MVLSEQIHFYILQLLFYICSKPIFIFLAVYPGLCKNQGYNLGNQEWGGPTCLPAVVYQLDNWALHAGV